MMTLKEIGDSASALGNQIRAGIPMSVATGRLRLLQPKYADFWVQATKSIESGRPLSESLVAVWPESLVGAVVAGEESGQIEDVFANVEETIAVQLNVRSAMMKLAYPAAIIVIGVIAFLGIMGFVVPRATDAFREMGVSNDSVFATISVWIVSFGTNYWPYIVAAVGIGAAAVIHWFRTEDGRRRVVEFFLGAPLLGAALLELCFGVWGRYMALMASAGIGINQALLVSAKVLPETLQSGVLLLERDLTVNNRSLEDSVNPDLQPEGDPRRDWPFYISTALMTADTTGRLDVELLRVAPSLIKSAEKSLQRFIFAGMAASIAIAGSLLAMSIAAIYLPIISALTHAH